MPNHPTDDIQNLIRTLRGKNGCPWDKKQTPESMGRYIVEEVYELTEAIESDDPNHVCEELGDVLFLVLFIIVLFEEKNSFAVKDVADCVISKMTQRHPHVFGTDKAETAEDVKQRWQQLKKNEKSKSSPVQSVPAKLPALLRAVLLSERMASDGNSGLSDDPFRLLQDVETQWSDVKLMLSDRRADDSALLQSAFGKLFFGLVNLARTVRIHPETALKDYMKYLEKQRYPSS